VPRAFHYTPPLIALDRPSRLGQEIRRVAGGKCCVARSCAGNARVTHGLRREGTTREGKNGSEEHTAIFHQSQRTLREVKALGKYKWRSGIQKQRLSPLSRSSRNLGRCTFRTLSDGSVALGGGRQERERERERERTSQQIYRGVIGDRVAEAAEGEGCPIRREAQQQRRGKMHFRSAGGRGKFRRTAKSPEELEEV
jgi:hypothetical protein